MSMFDVVVRSGTNGASYGISTSDIVEVLERWDASYGLDIIDVGRHRLLLGFRSLPDDLSRLAEDVYGICPDVLAEHVTCLDETVTAMQKAGLGALTEGMDFEERLGLELLEATLRATRAVALCWH